jgi:hypothetical protein
MLNTPSLVREKGCVCMLTGQGQGDDAIEK